MQQQAPHTHTPHTHTHARTHTRTIHAAPAVARALENATVGRGQVRFVDALPVSVVAALARLVRRVGREISAVVDVLRGDGEGEG